MSVSGTSTDLLLAFYSPSARRRTNAIGTAMQNVTVTGDATGGTMRGTLAIPLAFARRYMFRLLAYGAAVTGDSTASLPWYMQLTWTIRGGTFHTVFWGEEGIGNAAENHNIMRGRDYLVLSDLIIESLDAVNLQFAQQNLGAGRVLVARCIWELLSDYSEPPGAAPPGPP